MSSGFSMKSLDALKYTNSFILAFFFGSKDFKGEAELFVVYFQMSQYGLWQSFFFMKLKFPQHFSR